MATRQGLLRMALLLFLAVLFAPSVSEARSLYFGISANSRSRGTVAQDRAAQTGVRRLREDLEWRRVEPVNNTWDWSATDAMYRRAAERGMTILPILNSPPCWAVAAEPPSNCSELFPVSNLAYADFASHAVERYGPSGTFWTQNPDLDAGLASRFFEIWNEPYWGTGAEPVNPAKYAQLYTTAVSAGRQADPDARYLIESTVDGEGGVHWAEALEAAKPNIGSYIDGIATHPYPGSHDVTYQPQYGTDEAFLNVKIDYERWRSLGVNKPVWITEVGYSSCDDGAVHCVSGETQADRESRKSSLLAQLLDLVATDDYGFVHALYLYNLEQFTAATEPNSAKSAWYGIVYGKTGEHLPAWNSFSSAVSKYDGAPIPSVNITSHTVSSRNVSLSFSSNDPTAEFECRLDKLAWSSCSSPASFSVSGAGTHTVSVRAINAEATSGASAFSWTTPFLRPDVDQNASGWSLVDALNAWDALTDSVAATEVPTSVESVSAKRSRLGARSVGPKRRTTGPFFRSARRIAGR